MNSITRYIVGLDLGQAADPSALAVLEQTRPEPEAEAGHAIREATYGVRELRRWPLGTAYPAIVAEVIRLCATPPLLDCRLVIDGTGCGRAVVDLFRLSPIRASVRPVLITAGHAVSSDDHGYTHVAKVQLVSTMLALMGTRRIKFAKKLPLAKTVETELQNFKVKINIASATESFEAWREGQHDDLAFAVMLAAWVAEQAFDFTPELVQVKPNEARQNEGSWQRRGHFGYGGRHAAFPGGRGP
jgi:hypothetical protein